jgi:putative DNA primase/helicase
MTVAELLAKYGIKLESTAPGRYETTCPRCSAKRSTKEHRAAKVLGITIEADDKVRFGCNHCDFKGPNKGDSEIASGKGGGGKDRYFPTHIYLDAAGIIRFGKVRNPPGREPKCFFVHPDGKGGWAKGAGGADTGILYRIDEVATAAADGRIIACVEGEKDADRLWSIGIAATCNAHGASEPGKKVKWTEAHSEQLKGADIVVLNDNDAAGYAHADAAARLSFGIAKSVRRLDLAKHWADMPKGNDVSDWLNAGHAREELEALIAGAPDYAPDPEAKMAAEAASGAGAIDDDAELEQLARMPLLEYERMRRAAGERLGIKRLSMLDVLVRSKRAELGFVEDTKAGRPIEFPTPESWPEPVEGSSLLEAISSAIGGYVVMPEHAHYVCALWVVHTYMLDQLMISPRLAVRSPTKQCGKSTLLDVLRCLVLRPLRASNLTASVAFRVIERRQPTLLVDEADTFLFKDETLRGVLDGNRRGEQVLRNVSDEHEPRAFSTFCAAAIAVIGQLPGTLTDRSVAIDLKRRLPSEPIERFRFDRVAHLDQLARQIARWVNDNGARIGQLDPELPPSIYNRTADNWLPLLALADVAGGAWPDRARTAMLQAYAGAAGDDTSRIELLLGDVRDIFDTLESDRLSSAALIEHLVEIMPRPWAEYGKSGKPITQNKLARLLQPLGPVRRGL